MLDKRIFVPQLLMLMWAGQVIGWWHAVTGRHADSWGCRCSSAAGGSVVAPWWPGWHDVVQEAACPVWPQGEILPQGWRLRLAAHQLGGI